jgi:hypothetical protein
MSAEAKKKRENASSSLSLGIGRRGRSNVTSAMCQGDGGLSAQLRGVR